MNLAEMSQLVSERLNEADAPTYYPSGEITAAINESYRCFCLLTLALETTVAWIVPPATTFFHMLTAFPAWIVPLRITNAAGAKVRPARLSDLWALDSQWVSSPGAMKRYSHNGADLLALYPQPPGGDLLTVTYATAPAALVEDTDTPAIPANLHIQLVGYAQYRCRQVEGGEAFARALPLFGEYMDAAEKYGAYIRARNIGAGYDRAPFELKGFDRSRLVGLSKTKA